MTHRFARMAAIVLLAWQAILMQAHAHAPQRLAPTALTAAVHASAGLTAPERRRDAPADCPVCREVAHAGQYLSPGTLLFAAPVTRAVAPASAAGPALHRADRSHFWRSRAPPPPQS